MNQEEKTGYIHKTVNHSVEFDSEEAFHTNKIDGHWRQMKARGYGRNPWRYANTREHERRFVERSRTCFQTFQIRINMADMSELAKYVASSVDLKKFVVSNVNNKVY